VIGVSRGNPRKKLRFWNIFLTNICVIFTIEACASSAQLGYSSVFWWLLLFVTYLLPYGLIVSELGTTYSGGAGVYEWVRKAFGPRWGAREAWWYWVNYFTWLASIAVLFPVAVNAILPRPMPMWLSMGIELAFIWFVVLVSSYKVDQTNWIMNSGALSDLFLAICVIGVGLWYSSSHGFSTPVTPSSFVPRADDLRSLSGLDIIIYNYMGTEVIATFVNYMDNPKRDIPKSVVLAGLAMLGIYLAISLGVSIAIPPDQIEADSGLLDAMCLMLGQKNVLYCIVSVCFLWSCFTDMMSWATGVAQVTHQAGIEGALPRVFGYETRKGHLYVGATVTTGVVASALVLAEPLFFSWGIGVFDVVFSIDVVYTLLAYVPMFPAFLKLRRVDPDRERPYKVPGSYRLLKVISWIAVAELVVSIVMTSVPLNTTPGELEKLPLLVMSLVVFVLGEVVSGACARGAREVREASAQPAVLE
jgi:amino acid transporter